MQFYAHGIEHAFLKVKTKNETLNKLVEDLRNQLLAISEEEKIQPITSKEGELKNAIFSGILSFQWAN